MWQFTCSSQERYLYDNIWEYMLLFFFEIIFFFCTDVRLITMLGQGLINVQYLQGIELQDTTIVLNDFCLTKKGQEKSSTKRKKCLNIEGEETDSTMRFTEYFF